jgi:hypothetical protein
VIARFRRGLNGFFRLLGYYAAEDGLKPMFRNYLSLPSSMVLTLDDATDKLIPKSRFQITFFFWRNSPTRASAASFLRFLDHTQ